MPRLWSETIEAHRRDVRAAILQAAWQLAMERGVLSVTMAQVAAAAGIGRATLYKYFSGVEEILVAHHAQHVQGHLQQLREVAARGGDPEHVLRAVLEGYARICHWRARHGAPDLGALVHAGEEVRRAEQEVTDIIAQCLRAAQDDGVVRSDVAASELASYCRHALAAAGAVPTEASARRLVDVVAAGLRPGGG